MRLPPRRWICTQGVTVPTHKDRWRHAWDFEVLGPDGKAFRGDGSKPDQYYCFRLPVLSPAPGTVVRIENDIPDNLVGTMNLKQNWGNLVLIHHGVGIYSLLAHLSRGSVKVQLGQVGASRGCDRSVRKFWTIAATASALSLASESGHRCCDDSVFVCRCSGDRCGPAASALCADSGRKTAGPESGTR